MLVSLRLLDPCSHALLILGESSKSKKVKWCMNRRQFKDPLIIAHARLAQMDKHQTLDLVIVMLSPTGGNLFVLL